MSDSPKDAENAVQPSAEVAKALQEFEALELRRYAFRATENYLDFAEAAIDPPEAATGRAIARGQLDSMDHELLCGDEAGRLLEILDGAEGLSDVQRDQVRVFTRDRKQKLGVPTEIVAAINQEEGPAGEAWKRAREADDWSIFEPHLDKLVALFIESAKAQNPDMDPYDVWLDVNQPGSSQKTLDPFFDQVGEVVSRLVKNVRQEFVDVPEPPQGPFDPAVLHQLFLSIAKLEGLDLNRLSLGETIHPVTNAIDSHHVMIADHTDVENVIPSVFSTLHESGHCMYETHIDSAYDYTCCANGVSADIHEGQGRFYENYIGRNEAFAPTLLKLLAEFFPEQYGSLDAHDLWRLVNHVKPGVSRMEADELTYPLHIMVRYEVEKQLFSGQIKAAGVPEVWNALYQKVLGVTPQGALEGPLSDVHWSIGLFGYFPGYALGGAYGAQLVDAMKRDGVDFDGALAKGDLSPISDWLTEHLWRFGRTKEPRELLIYATGKPFDPKYYLDYLEKKYGPEDASA